MKCALHVSGLIRYAHSQTNGKTNNSKAFGSKKVKEPKQDSQNWLG